MKSSDIWQTRIIKFSSGYYLRIVTTHLMLSEGKGQKKTQFKKSTFFVPDKPKRAIFNDGNT